MPPSYSPETFEMYRDISDALITTSRDIALCHLQCRVLWPSCRKRWSVPLSEGWYSFRPTGQLRRSAYLGAVQLVTLYVTSTPAFNTKCGRQMKKGSFVSTHPSPVRGSSRKHPPTYALPPRAKSIQIPQPSPVTPVRRPRGASREALTARRCHWTTAQCPWTTDLGAWTLALGPWSRVQARLQVRF